MAAHSSILAWRIPWTEEPAGYSPWCRKETDTTEQVTLLLSSSRGWGPRALSWVTALLPHSCAGGSPVCPHGLPLSHSAPSPATAPLTVLVPALQAPLEHLHLVVPDVKLSSYCPLSWTCCLLPFFGCVGAGTSSGKEPHLWHKVGNERLTDLKNLHGR